MMVSRGPGRSIRLPHRLIRGALGDRPTFADLGATVAEWLNVGFRGQGTSFLPLLERGH